MFVFVLVVTACENTDACFVTDADSAVPGNVEIVSILYIFVYFIFLYYCKYWFVFLLH